METDLIMIVGGFIGLLAHQFGDKNVYNSFSKSLNIGNYVLMFFGIIGIIRFLYHLFQ